MLCKWFRRRPQISLLVPFRDNGEGRGAAWSWLQQFWRDHLHSAEIVMGNSVGLPFNKAVAVNDAARRARGRIFMVLDADAYMDPTVIQDCADQIDAAVRAKKHLWFMPYDKLYRLNTDATTNLIKSNPALSYKVSSPPPPAWLEANPDPSGGHSCIYGHQYGAMAMVMPRQAFTTVNGMDPRFRWGWGSEDASFLKALDALYGQHEVARADILHLWHTRPGTNWETRKWVGQNFAPGNSRLAQRYQRAAGEPGWMRALVDEYKD
jgi:N-terminal domain of galactosyltransferase/Glycosyl transferase family 2